MKPNGENEWINASDYIQWICNPEEAERFCRILKDQGFSKVIVIPIERKKTDESHTL